MRRRDGMAGSGWETSVLDRGTWWVGVGNDDEDCATTRRTVSRVSVDVCCCLTQTQGAEPRAYTRIYTWAIRCEV